MRIPIAYGRGYREIDLPRDRAVVIQPGPVAGLIDEQEAVTRALDHPIASASLGALVRPDSRVCITFSDLTRATPNDRLIPWLLDYLGDVAPDRITLVNQTGTHRPNTTLELEGLLTPDVLRRHRVINHEPENHDLLVALGTTGDGTPALINRHLVEADLRIITGFIEPHFFAGFSGGPKGIIPGCGGLATIMSNHGSRNIGHPNATFGITEGNPLWEELRDIALRVGPSFLLNVTLNDHRAITGVFAGDLVQAHRRGTEFVRQSAMQAVDQPFDVVVTGNSGYPLDLNLYQGVKGLSAAGRIVRPGGTIILACECSEGVPDGSPFDRLLRKAEGPAQLLRQLAATGTHVPEQWQAQILAQLRQQAKILVHSSLDPDTLRACHLQACPDIGAAVREELDRLGPHSRVALLPYGPLTIPYLA